MARWNGRMGWLDKKPRLQMSNKENGQIGEMKEMMNMELYDN
jgi:hypothetical protein